LDTNLTPRADNDNHALAATGADRSRTQKAQT
jgi:hypothetical protein